MCVFVAHPFYLGGLLPYVSNYKLSKRGTIK